MWTYPEATVSTDLNKIPFWGLTQSFCLYCMYLAIPSRPRYKIECLMHSVSKRLTEQFTMRSIFMIWTRTEFETKTGLADRVDQLLTTFTPTSNWCVKSEASVLDIHDMRAYLCHYSSLTGPRFISFKISDVSRCYCSISRHSLWSTQ
jgi:hypothetical protein